MQSFMLNRLKQPPPDHCCVLENSSPVLYFGEPRHGGVATLSINPSRWEFIGREGWLSGEQRRFLKMNQLLTDDDCCLAKSLCDDYFLRNPNWTWFKHLEREVLGPIGASYRDGSACHLDIVQWATDPAWGKLTQDQKNTLINGDSAYFVELLNFFNFKKILLNGKTAVTTFLEALQIEKKDFRSEHLGGLEVFSGSLPARSLEFRGWNIPVDKAISSSDRNLLRSFLSRAATRKG